MFILESVPSARVVSIEMVRSVVVNVVEAPAVRVTSFSYL